MDGGAAPTQKIRSQCPYCGVGCGIVLEVGGGQVLKVSGDREHSVNRGRLCTKGSSCHVPLTAPGRADRAMMRDSRDAAFTAATTDAAIARTAEGLRRIIDRDGPDAVALYVSGQMSIEAQYLANKLAKGYIRTRHIESNSRLCMASAGTGYKLSLGSDGPPGSYDDLDLADLFFVIGSNMADCHPILFLRMMDRVRAGAKLIVVDPRRSATAEKADLFLQIRPGSDLALLNGLLHLLRAAGHVDADFIAAHTEGWEALGPVLDACTLVRTAAETGLDAAQIQQAADWIGAAGNWVSLWTMGLNQSVRGTANSRAICNLHLATGAISRPGSGPFSLTGQPNAMGGREMGYMGPGLPGQRSAMVPADRAFTEQVWALPEGTLRAEAGGGTIDMFRRMSTGEIRACWIICTNPVASVANRDTVKAALAQAELVIAQDAFADTETTRAADILLPGALWAEAAGVMVNSERDLTLCPQAISPPGAALADWEIIARVARAMGYGAAFDYRSAAEVFDEIRAFHNPATGYDIRGTSHAALSAGPMQWPVAPGGGARNPIRYRDPDAPGGLRFATASGRAQFALPPDTSGPAEATDAEFPLVLNTGRVQHQWHTMTKTGTVPALNRLAPGPFAEIHPEDAAARGIQDGAPVEISSRRGRAVLPAVVTDRVRPGTCFAPFHWNDLAGEDLAVNAVTNDATDPLSLQPEFKFAAVALKAAPPAPGPAQTVPGTLARALGLTDCPLPAFSEAERLYLAGMSTALHGRTLAPGEGVPLLPDHAPLSQAGRAYVNGLLAGLYAGTAGNAPAAPMLTLLWASQTGTAERCAADCARTLEAAGWRVALQSLSQTAPGDLRAMTQVLFVTSTFGDGDPPDDAATFWEQLTATAPDLAGLNHAVLAMGDSSYAQFCGFGRALDAKLAALGSKALTARADCEPDFEDRAQDWLARVMAALGPAPSAAPAPATPPRPAVALPGSDRNHPVAAQLVVNHRLNGAGSARDVRQFGIAPEAPGLVWEAGDALGIWPENDPAEVARWLDTLGLAADAPVVLKDAGDVTLSEALTKHLDLSRPGEALEAELNAHTPELVGGAATTDAALPLLARIAGSGLRLDAAALVRGLRRVQPRLYSIASSPRHSPGRIDLTVSVLRFGDGRSGLSSGYLADRAAAGALRVFRQKSDHFRLPENGATDVIMIGPGTGIAPFRAFLQERAATGATGRNWLFFGAQHAERDFYYRDEIEAWQASGHLTRLDLAFSRDQAERIYVQHRMREQGAEMWRWIEAGARIYICGDAAQMARDVEETLCEIFRTEGGLNAEAAQDHLRKLRRDGRYSRDVY